MKKYIYDVITGKQKGFVPGLFWVFLYFLSLIYSLVLSLLVFWGVLNKRKLAPKVISVGNITLGGTGKTVLVEFISDYLRKSGRKVGILSRGYKRNNRSGGQGLGVAAVSVDKPDYQAMGDEPYMLSLRLGDIPVIVDPDRARAVQKAAREYGVDTVILDDGFQQWRISKDLEIVAIDSTNPFGNGHLIPAGILREPVSRLKKADIFVLTRVDPGSDIDRTKAFLKRANPAALIVETMHYPVGLYRINDPKKILDPGLLKDEPVALLSGIGNPDSFEALIKRSGIKASLILRYPDHHHYSQKELNDLADACLSKSVKSIVTTEKDAARIQGSGLVMPKIDLLVLRIKLKINHNEEQFCSRLLSLYAA